MFDRRCLLLSGFAGFILVAAGCQSGDSSQIPDAGNTPKPAEEKVTEAELRGFCPKVTLRDGTSFFNTYQKGATDDATKIVYQASIVDVTRTCRDDGGTFTMNIAVAGKIVPGPAFAPGTITMPIRIAVTRGEEVLYSNLHSYQVEIADSSAATQFVFNDPNVSFVLPADRGVRIFAGYDEGPKKKPTAEE